MEKKNKEMMLAYGSDQIQKAGILLQLQAVTIASGQSILHKFYAKHDLKEFDIRVTAATSLFLACKLEENHRKLDQVAKIFEFLRYYEDEKKEYKYSVENENSLKREMLRTEREILVGFAFRLDKLVVSPHRYVLQYAYALFRNLDKCTPHSVDELAQRAWGYLNDSMRTSLCCELKPGVIAAGCIYLAATSLGIPLKKVRLGKIEPAGDGVVQGVRGQLGGGRGGLPAARPAVRAGKAQLRAQLASEYNV